MIAQWTVIVRWTKGGGLIVKLSHEFQNVLPGLRNPLKREQAKRGLGMSSPISEILCDWSCGTYTAQLSGAHGALPPRNGIARADGK
jgi:hypothetical protein